MHNIVFHVSCCKRIPFYSRCLRRTCLTRQALRASASYIGRRFLIWRLFVVLQRIADMFLLRKSCRFDEHFHSVHQVWRVTCVVLQRNCETFCENEASTPKTRNIRKFGPQMGPGPPEAKKVKNLSFLKKQSVLEKSGPKNQFFPPSPLPKRQKCETFVKNIYQAVQNLISVKFSLQTIAKYSQVSYRPHLWLIMEFIAGMCLWYYKLKSFAIRVGCKGILVHLHWFTLAQCMTIAHFNVECVADTLHRSGIQFFCHFWS